MRPRDSHSAALNTVEEAMTVAFRRRTLLPLDDVFGCLRGTIPKLTRSSLHRRLDRYGISRLPEDPNHPFKAEQVPEGNEAGLEHVTV